MTGKDFIEENIFKILIACFFLFFLLLLFSIFHFPFLFFFSFILFYVVTFSFSLFLTYRLTKKRYDEMIRQIDQLEEQYLAALVLPKPRKLENKAYYYALQKASQAMNDKITKLEKGALEYQEYLESFVHEVKTPLSALALSFENKKDRKMLQEVEKIDRLLKQMLYYARSETTEKDYFVKKINLSDPLHEVLMEYKQLLLDKKVKLMIHDVDIFVYCDLKWLVFILEQVIQNSIKYFDKKEKKLEIRSLEEQNDVKLFIKDNGCGISSDDLPRIFDKGFTGRDRTKKEATGMGLYLAKKLCDKLHLSLTISSKEGKETLIILTFPKNDFFVSER